MEDGGTDRGAKAAASRSDLDVLIIRETSLGIVDRVADLKLAAQTAVGLDLIVVTPA